MSSPDFTFILQHWDRVYPIHEEMKKRTRRVVFILKFRIGMKSEFKHVYHENYLMNNFCYYSITLGFNSVVKI